ncbi:C40 family peptidase [Glutamicibacter creatinolyticus]|uniref:C40 family peptidase n=1 Tax=Glutamicibacter creatinolyticus TaxID=162496 RepID=UPI0033F10646
MSYTDVAARIGQIQSTLAQVRGATDTARSSQPAAASAAATPLLAGAAATGGAGATGGTTASAFTQALQSAMDTGKSTGGTAGSAPGTGTGTTTTKASGAVAPPVTDPPPTKDGVDGSEVVRAAKKYLGVPYVWGGNNPAVGLDCSSFVQHTFRDLGINLPRVARQQAKEGTEVPSLAQAKPGDLIVTRGGGHIGIYLGGNQMIHAPRPGEKVSIRKLFETDAQIMTIRRIVPATSPQQAAAASAAAASTSGSAAAAQADLVAAAQRTLFTSSVGA